MNNKIRGIRQGIPGGTYLGRAAGGGRGSVVPLPFPNSANATATTGGFTPQASVSAAGVSFTSKGVWDTTAAYLPSDVVTYKGSAYANYVAVAAPGPNTAPDTDTTHWLSQGAVNTVDSNFSVVTGQLRHASIASGHLLANGTGSSAEPTNATLTAVIDNAIGAVEGQILQRGASVWQILSPGTSGQVLISGGASALNSWGTDELGVATNSNAAAGFKGQFVSSSIGGTSQTTATITNLGSISLTAGDWDVFGGIQYTASGGVLSDVYACVSTTTMDSSQVDMLATPWQRINGLASPIFSVAPPPLRVSVSGTTTVYLVAFCQFTGTATAIGAIRARRIR